MVFTDREQAGRLLARRLERLRAERPIVLGLTRGGVPVGYEVARALDAPFDVLVVLKLGAPDFPEYALGAIAEGGSTWLNAEAIRAAGLDDEEVASLAEREKAELARRVRVYRAGRVGVNLSGRTVIVVDDGVGTGATARAAARSVRRQGSARVVLAAPVIAAACEVELGGDFDEVVALERPVEFRALRSWYERFGPLSVEDVLEYLHRAIWVEPPGGAAGELWNGEGNDSAAARSLAMPEERTVTIPSGASGGSTGVLEGSLSLPSDARGLVIFMHGSGSSRRDLAGQSLAEGLQREGFATLLFDLLTPEEMAQDARTHAFRFEVELLTGRVVAALRWAAGLPGLAGRIGCFGVETGAAAALAAAALRPELVSAVVSLCGRPDLVDAPALEDVRAPVLLIVGEGDAQAIAESRVAFAHLPAAELAVVGGGRNPLEEPEAWERVLELAAEWFCRHVTRAGATSR